MASVDSGSVFTQDKEFSSPRPVSPTDISQFIRLDQCQRFLRLQLHSRQMGDSFMREYDVTLQAIPPILTRSGARFEELIEQDVIGRFPATRFNDEERKTTGTPHDNAAVIARARALAPGEAHVLFQPRLRAEVGDWSIRGVMDILRLERDRDGRLHCLIADMKASTASRVEHRLQVAIYHEMLAAIFDRAHIEHAPLELAILYRGPAEETDAADRVDPELQQRQREDAIATFGTQHGYLERIVDTGPYLGSVQDLLTGPESTARRVLEKEFEAVPFHLTYKCDGCLYNEFCMKRSAETDDLSLLPHLSDQDKSILRKNGISTVRQVAELKDLVTPGDNGSYPQLIPATGKEDLCRRLAVTWPVGQHLDELVHRAQRYLSWKKQGPSALSYIPNKGYGTLPYSGPDLHPNLVRVYIDAQHDYLNDRIYMIGARVVASNNGIEELDRQRNVVRITAGPPDSNEIEEQLFVDWIAETLRATVELAAPDADGNHAAPIHLVFINRFAQQQLLNGLGRYLTKILGATALYDFMTQMAIYDSPIASFLDQEIQEQKNYPMVCQSLQAVAAYLKFDWNKDVPYREIFRTRMFDFWRKFDAEIGEEQRVPGINGWYTSRARFNSQIPLEYAYTAWGDVSEETSLEPLSDYGEATVERMLGFQARRLEAMEHIAKDFRGNRQTTLTSFALPDLANFEQCAPTLAHALDEFVSIERFVDLTAWKHQRLAPPEQRVLGGESLVVRYVEADQEPGIAEQNRENQVREERRQRYRAEWRAANPNAKQIRLPKDQKADSDWNHVGTRFRLRIETDDLACNLDEALNLSTIKSGSRLVLYDRWSFDARLPEDQRAPFTSSAKQILYGPRVELIEIDVVRDDLDRAVEAFAVVEILGGGGGDKRGFLFGSGSSDPLVPDHLYTLDPDPNSINGFWAAKVTEGLIDGNQNTLYRLLIDDPAIPLTPCSEAAAAQQRFMDGLVALHHAGKMVDFEPAKHAFISQHGDDPVLLVQGPPGTGKSFSTAYALLARIQGRMAVGQPCRVILSCKTHAATDVLLQNVLEAREQLRRLFDTQPEMMEQFFDRRLCEVPLFRQRPRGDVAEGITPLSRELKPKDVIVSISAPSWSVTASTPGGIYSMVKDDLFGQTFIDYLVLDEASQMSIPEAIMAALPLKEDGRLIVVGDHRQMPPIVSHDWSNETRRTFREFRSYESLFLALLALDPPKINFERSFRLHADLAEFLRKEIYHQDGINYHSKRHDVLPTFPLPDSFIEAVLVPQHPLTVVVHDEAESQHRNRYEQELIAPILRVLADEQRYNLSPEEGLGVVVPHRAQRAALQDGVPELRRLDPETKAVIVSAVDTVERFQGDERTVILIGSTESDREYLLATGNFLLDPRRLTVALSRAKKKLVLVASRSVFEIFSADEEMFRNAQLWKNLLRGTCTVRLWEGDRHGHQIQVWGNVPSEPQA
jgi:hypothetical protein